MSDVAASITDLAEGAALDACWRQWRSLQGEGRVSGEPAARSIIDPEALMLASLWLRHREGRLRDLLAWWLPHGSHLLSVQRSKTLLQQFPESARSGVAWFAARAAKAGDKRWSRLAADHEEEPARAGKGPAALHFIEASTLMLRLRAGFGVGAKADLLTFLIGANATQGAGGRWVKAGQLPRALAYSTGAVRRAATDMALARLIEVSAERPPMYSVDGDAWARLLHLDDAPSPSFANVFPADGPPPWRYWAQVYSLLASCAAWGHDAHEQGWPPVVQASKARDIADRFQAVANWNHWPTLDAAAHPGERLLQPFADWVQGVCHWVGENA